MDILYDRELRYWLGYIDTLSSLYDIFMIREAKTSINRHTVKFLGLSQKKLYNEFYAGNHLVWYPRPKKMIFEIL